MTNTVRIYGKTINTWKHLEERNGREIEVTTQMEIEYKEYDLDGNIVSSGTEDFSPERYRNSIAYPSVYTWDGKKLNKGGHRWFDFHGSIKFLKSQRKEVKEYLKRKYVESEVIQLRTN